MIKQLGLGTETWQIAYNSSLRILSYKVPLETETKNSTIFVNKNVTGQPKRQDSSDC